ncbi:hypothetical protein F5Y04DRAFT_292384 [Hypomontagnella monticulosa]|nr:hypothetical protein F5Y04DRAFT_292384 [Hypomontagnella monticulosa]
MAGQANVVSLPRVNLRPDQGWRVPTATHGLGSAKFDLLIHLQNVTDAESRQRVQNWQAYKKVIGANYHPNQVKRILYGNRDAEAVLRNYDDVITELRTLRGRIENQNVDNGAFLAEAFERYLSPEIIASQDAHEILERMLEYANCWQVIRYRALADNYQNDIHAFNVKSHTTYMSWRLRRIQTGNSIAHAQNFVHDVWLCDQMLDPYIRAVNLTGLDPRKFLYHEHPNQTTQFGYRGDVEDHDDRGPHNPPWEFHNDFRRLFETMYRLTVPDAQRIVTISRVRNCVGEIFAWFIRYINRFMSWRNAQSLKTSQTLREFNGMDKFRRLQRYFYIIDRGYEWFLTHVREFLVQYRTLNGRLRLRTWLGVYGCILHLNHLVRTSKLNASRHNTFDTMGDPLFFPNFNREDQEQWNEGPNNLPALLIAFRPDGDPGEGPAGERQPTGPGGPAGPGIAGGPGAHVVLETDETGKPLRLGNTYYNEDSDSENRHRDGSNREGFAVNFDGIKWIPSRPWSSEDHEEGRIPYRQSLRGGGDSSSRRRGRKAKIIQRRPRKRGVRFSSKLRGGGAKRQNPPEPFDWDSFENVSGGPVVIDDPFYDPIYWDSSPWAWDTTQLGSGETPRQSGERTGKPTGRIVYGLKAPEALKQLIKSGDGIPRGPRRGNDIPNHQIAEVVGEVVKVSMKQDQQLTQWIYERPSTAGGWDNEDFYDTTAAVGPDPMVIDSPSVRRMQNDGKRAIAQLMMNEVRSEDRNIGWEGREHAGTGTNEHIFAQNQGRVPPIKADFLPVIQVIQELEDDPIHLY